ncbi:MAG: hypothetical protein FJ098_15205 [Deltaproteobacteria bacterium]|nr:hypothetical protein [Deltaproteobacteria bacterium]
MIFRAGVRRVSASHLHVTEGVERRLRARLGPARCGLILRSYQRPAMVPSRDLRDGGEAPRAARPLRESRLEAYRVLHRLAARLGVVFTVCSCRNPDLDLPGEACYSIPPGASAPPRTPRRQLDLL